MHKQGKALKYIYKCIKLMFRDRILEKIIQQVKINSYNWFCLGQI